jgi:hypothetical protein
LPAFLRAQTPTRIVVVAVPHCPAGPVIIAGPVVITGVRDGNWVMWMPPGPVGERLGCTGVPQFWELVEADRDCTGDAIGGGIIGACSAGNGAAMGCWTMGGTGCARGTTGSIGRCSGGCWRGW